MRRLALVLLVVLIIAGGAPALLGGKKSPPAWCTGCIPVTATFRNGTNGTADAIQADAPIPGIIQNGYFNFESGSISIKFSFEAAWLTNVNFALGFPPPLPNIDPTTLKSDNSYNTMCMGLTYFWWPSNTTEKRLMFHSFEENTSSSPTYYAVVTCTESSEGPCTSWTIEPAVGKVQEDGKIVCQAGSDAVGALWEFISGKKPGSGTSGRVGLYKMPHKIFVTTP